MQPQPAASSSGSGPQRGFLGMARLNARSSGDNSRSSTDDKTTPPTARSVRLEEIEMLDDTSSVSSSSSVETSDPDSALGTVKTSDRADFFTRLTKKLSYKEQGDDFIRRKSYDLAYDAYILALQEAESKKEMSVVADRLKDIGRVYLEQKKWDAAARLFNAALSLYEQYNKGNDVAKKSVLEYMVELEKKFLIDRGVKNGDALGIHYGSYSSRRDELSRLRAEVEDKIGKNVPAKDILREFSDGVGSIVEKLFTDATKIFGPPPCKFAFLALGSLARKEMNPYSDLEFAILLENPTEENIKYFTKVVEWLELQVINLGETSILCLDNRNTSPIKSGFSFDSGGNTPRGKKELIGSVESLAAFQNEGKYQEDVVLSNILLGARRLFGSTELYSDYAKLVKDKLSKNGKESSLSLGQQRALDTLNIDMMDCEPKIDKQKEENPYFNIKNELLRNIGFSMGGLCDALGIEELNTWDKIEALKKKRIISEEGAQNIEKALNDIMYLRMRCHLRKKGEDDNAVHPSMNRKSVAVGKMKDAFFMTRTDMERVIEIYQVILPLNRLVKEACSTKKFGLLCKQTFKESTPITRSEAFEKLGKIKEAKKCYTEALALSPDDVDLHVKYVELLLRLHEVAEAESYINKEIKVGSRQGNEVALAKALSGFGKIAMLRGDYDKSFCYYQQALDILKAKLGPEHPDVADVLVGIGIVHKQSEAPIANCYFESALRIYQQKYGTQHPNVAKCLVLLGDMTFLTATMSEVRKGIQHVEKALKIIQGLHGSDHPDVAEAYNVLGLGYFCARELKNALNYNDKALEILKKVYGEEHPQVALTYHYRALILYDDNKFKEALFYAGEAIKVMQFLSEDKNPDILDYHCNKGRILNTLRRFNEASQAYKDAIEVAKSLKGEEHAKLGMYYTRLGETYLRCKDYSKAIESFLEAVRLLVKYRGLPARLITAYERLGEAYKEAGFREKSKEALQEVKKLQLQQG